MLNIQEIGQKIKNSLYETDVIDLAIDSFVIGVVFERKQNKTSQGFQDVLELISGLRMMVDAQICEKKSIIDIYNKATILNGNIREMYNLLNEQQEINEVPDESQFYYSQQYPQKQQQQQFQAEKQEQIQEEKQFIKQAVSQFNPYADIKIQDSRYPQMYPIEQEEDLQSMIVARELQQQFEEEASLAEIYRQQDEEEQFKIKRIKEAETKNQVECKICLDVIPFDEMSVLNCSHIYHTKCLNQFCTTQIQARQFPLLCPAIECKKPIIYSDLSEVLDDVNLNDFQQFTFKNYIESHGDEYSWCPTPDCKYIFISGGNPYFECPICKKTYCLDCKIDYHIGQSCQEYKDKIIREKREKNEKVLDDQFLNFVRGSKFKQCPQCKFWVEKNQGCDHMTCRCKFQFCYVCGGVYQKCACVLKRR